MANLPVPSPRTYTVGEVETGAYFNATRDALTFSINRPMAVVYQSSAQSLANGSLTAVAMDTTVVDSYGGHSNSTNNSRYTAQVAGWYQLDGAYSISAINTTGTRDGQWAKNGAALTAPTGAGVLVGGSSAFSATVAMPGLQIQLNAGDYVEMWLLQNSGGALNTNVATFTSYMSIRWVHA